MIYPMQSNIESIVDFDRLKKANGICLKWATRLKIMKNDYIRFCVRMMKDFEGHKKRFEPRFWSQLSKDRKVMFYAAEIEDIIVRQYHAMIFRIFKILHIPVEVQPELETEGMMAVRSAVWHFREHKGKATFTTFCYNNIMMRVKGVYGKMRRNNAMRMKKFHIYSESDIDVNVRFDRLIGAEDAEYSETGTIEQELARLFALCNLTENEKDLINAYINRHSNPTWSKAYRHKIGSPKGDRPLSKQATHMHLDRVQRKIFNVLQKIGYVNCDHVEVLTGRKRMIR
jgi:hypothetical protein